MSFSVKFKPLNCDFFQQNSKEVVKPPVFFDFLQKQFPYILHPSQNISEPFQLYLHQFGFNGTTSNCLATFLEDCPYSLEELKVKFLQEWISLAYCNSQKNNSQVFFYQLLLKWVGTSAEGRSSLFQTHFKMPKSTFYLKYNAFAKQCSEETQKTLAQSNFVVWFDNFTKIFGQDYCVTSSGKTFSVYDLTVCCAFLLTKEADLQVNTPVSPSVQTCHYGQEVFQAGLSLAMEMPKSDPEKVLYRRYSGLFFVLIKTSCSESVVFGVLFGVCFDFSPVLQLLFVSEVEPGETS